MSDRSAPGPGGQARGVHPALAAAAWDSRAEALLSEPALGTPGARDVTGGRAAADRTAADRTANDRAAGDRAAGRGERLAGHARAAVTRRGSADPVKALLHRHRELCERAVDPLEIAAGLEAHGVTDRTAARFRHRDVFSLAEELYARVPQGDAATRHGSPPARTRGTAASWSARALLLALLPGAMGLLTVAGLTVTDGPLRTAVGVAGALGLAVALTADAGHATDAGRAAPSTRAWTGCLLIYALVGDGLLDQLLAGGPDGPWPLVVTPLLGLALAAAPAAWCARFFAARARRRLAGSRGLADFAAGARPLLLGTVVLYAAVMTALLALVGTVLDEGPPGGGAVALGVLLFLTRLLTVHGFPGAAVAGLVAACVTQALALASVLAGRLPGWDPLAIPVEAAVVAGGAATVPTLACGAAALALLGYATAVLGRASSHAGATAT
ncbi:hypothetical protein [Streptomyces gobitricini]|uniref:Integral membrane protein n=1 Tax=Streptomyces gobitricini TaxID=68211 RepID=A0ABN3N7G6_9ACTN